MAEAPEKIVMTPTKRGRATCIRIDKVRQTQIDDSKVAHSGGGQHSGLVINKKNQASAESTPPQLQLEFKCFLVDNKTGRHVPESRILKFWFAANTDYLEKVTGAYEFFKELVKPDEFPRDYVGFIKRIMKQAQFPKYQHIKTVEVEMEQLEGAETPPTSPGGTKLFGLPGEEQEDSRPKEIIIQENMLHLLESAYPNIMSIDDLAGYYASKTGRKMENGDSFRFSDADRALLIEQLNVLKEKNLIRQVEDGKWVRVVLDAQTEVKVFKAPDQIARMQQDAGGGAGSGKPSIAIITSKYYEKLAVDAMMEKKVTFVKYKSEGDSNVYTIGRIGSHTVVSTKIPQLGRGRTAQISASNTTTRLLGTFSDIEHVLLVGVAGGVPHYTDFYMHVRLGDIVVAAPNRDGAVYVFCDRVEEDGSSLQYDVKGSKPTDHVILDTFARFEEVVRNNPVQATWEHYIQDGQQLLTGQEVDFIRPPANSDKLYMNIGGSDIIEVGHPPLPDAARAAHRPGVPVVRAGCIGAGKPVVAEDRLRQDFAVRHACVAFDTEFDQVLASIDGNRKESFAFVRGISDYLDGSRGGEWQPYAALVAAAYTKALIEHLPSPGYDP